MTFLYISVGLLVVGLIFSIAFGFIARNQRLDKDE